VAFGDLLRDGVAWAEQMAGDDDAPLLRSVATDGETFGHHHKFAEMALARAIVELNATPDVRLENFASFLAREGVGQDVALIEPSAWSCAHGVDRWRADCGCRADTGTPSHQRWRAPLRTSLEWLAAGLHQVFEREGAQYFDDPWAARDAWVAGDGAAGHVAAGGFDHEASLGSVSRADTLLAMETNALRLFTSCAWFFDDVAGIEARQVLSYAARALELSGPEGPALRAGFLSRLAKAESNDPEVGTAADLFERDERARLAEVSP
jgi:hypothetical protein